MALQRGASLNDVIDAISAIFRGEQNNTGMFTLKPGSVATVVPYVNAAPGKTITFSPMTANAAAAIPTTYIGINDITGGSFTVRHANAATADRTFAFECTAGG